MCVCVRVCVCACVHARVTVYAALCACVRACVRAYVCVKCSFWVVPGLVLVLICDLWVISKVALRHQSRLCVQGDSVQIITAQSVSGQPGLMRSHSLSGIREPPVWCWEQNAERAGSRG